MDGPAFSVIIPYQSWNGFLEECLDNLLLQELVSFEVVLLPDTVHDLPVKYAGLKIVVESTGKVSPAIKRDRGAELARASLLAFIDDDAWPVPCWLKSAEAFLADNPDVAAVGGPAVTPAGDSFWSRVSGAVCLSRLAGGFPERYRPVSPGKYVDDWPSVNLIVRRKVFLEVGGFDSEYWPGEDTKLCRDIVALGWKIYYLPEMQVFHHRRATLKKHLRQIGNYGFHRGLFVRSFPETSRRPAFFMPSLLVLFVVVGGAVSPVSGTVLSLYLAGLSAYAAAILWTVFEISRHEGIVVSFLSVPYTVMTHLWYGVRFMAGLFAPKYKVSLGR